MNRYKYFNRDLSWLEFNHRVLEEAKDKSLPLFERLKFLAIYSNNLEEFYQVRLSYYSQLIKNQDAIPDKIAEVKPVKIVQQINETVTKLQIEFFQIFDNEIMPELKENGIILLDKMSKLLPEQEEEVHDIFVSEVMSVLQPVLLIKKKVRPFLKSGHSYLVLEMYNSDSKLSQLTRRVHYGLIKLPTDHNITRFIELTPRENKHYVMFLEDVIMRHINKIFPGYEAQNWYAIKLTRDADLDYDEYEGDELIDLIAKLTLKRSVGAPNRFQYDRTMPNKMLKYVMESFHIHKDILVQGGSYHNLRDFFRFPNPLSPELEIGQIKPCKHPQINDDEKIADIVNKQDVLLNVPYQSFEYFLNFLEEAARDPYVTEIKSTQYRVAERSAVVNALMNAAERGKRVTVFVELKARFDEEANLRYAAEMKKAGINIIYSIPNLKVHAKVALILRKENDKGLKNQAYLGTGNFNEKTARIYCDHGIFTSNEDIIHDLKNMFRYLETKEPYIKFKSILVPNFNLIHRFGQLINQEIINHKNGKKGYILLKMNGLQDPHMVDMLYRASEAGVKIDLIIRGICILKPGKKYSKNIRIIRIIDRFLEHARVFVFHNDGAPKVYLGSADWMKRNLYRRVECVFPVNDERNKQELIDILNIQLSDNVKACEIGSRMENIRVVNDQPLIQSQIATYEYFKQRIK